MVGIGDQCLQYEFELVEQPLCGSSVESLRCIRDADREPPPWNDSEHQRIIGAGGMSLDLVKFKPTLQIRRNQVQKVLDCDQGFEEWRAAAAAPCLAPMDNINQRDMLVGAGGRFLPLQRP